MEKSLQDVSIAADANGSGLGKRRLLVTSDDEDDDVELNAGGSGLERRLVTSDDDLENMLETEMQRAGIHDMPEAPQTKGKGKSKAVVPISPEDCVAKYHEMIRRTLVDWGDQVLDKVAARFAEDPKVAQQIEDVRKESIDPLRTWSALPAPPVPDV